MNKLNYRKSKKISFPDVKQVPSEIWKEEILPYYDFSDDIGSLLLVSKGMNQMIQEFLTKHG